MRTVTVTTLRARLGEFLDAASTGERIAIERRHRPTAVLVSPEDAGRLKTDDDVRLTRQFAALYRLEALGARIARDYPASPGTPDAATMIRMDRDRDDV